MFENEMVNRTVCFEHYSFFIIVAEKFIPVMPSLRSSIEIFPAHSSQAFLPLKSYYFMHNASLDCVLLLLMQRAGAWDAKGSPVGEEIGGIERKKGSFNPLKIHLCRDQRVDLSFESVTTLKAIKVVNKC